jgi:hypothetical protein
MEQRFVDLCKGGNLEQIKRFLEENPKIICGACENDIFDDAFHRVCGEGHLEVAKWLFNSKLFHL